MLPILTPDESAVLDAATAEEGVTTLSLMERAGGAVAAAAETVAGGIYGRRALVVCGKGNNGGDGLVTARHLDRRGMGVTALLTSGHDTFAGAAATNLRRFDVMGGRRRSFDPKDMQRELGRADVVVDALVGTGFRGEPRGGLAVAIAAINSSAVPVVAVDVPSGVEGQTGAVRGEAVVADVTVTFGTLKPGLVFYPGAAHAGVVEIADIGFPSHLIHSDLWLLERNDVVSLLPHRQPETHKRAAGTVVVVAGSGGMTGAGILTARAAYRAGAGLVTLAVPASILPVVQAAVTETTFLPLPETETGAVAEDSWSLLQERTADAHAVAVGPGLGTHPSTVALVRRLVAEGRSPLVIDADALNAFAGQAEALADRASEAVITPHAGEFGRLIGLSATDVLEDRVGQARKAADAFRCTVLLKGSRTVVAEPGGRTTVNPTGGSYLASGGTGDVLTGTIAALIAGGVGIPDAARAGAFLHGVAGRLASQSSGTGTVASDVVELLPAARREVTGAR